MSPAGGFMAPRSLQDAYHPSAFRFERHGGTLHEYNGGTPEECRFGLPEILGRRLYYVNISLDES
jgi:hypothetical protein